MDNFRSWKPNYSNKLMLKAWRPKVIQGAQNIIRQHQPAIYMVNDRIDNSAALIKLMWSLDYLLFWHTPALLNPSNYFQDPENIFRHTVSVKMRCLPKSAPSQLNRFIEIIDQHFHPMKKTER